METSWEYIIWNAPHRRNGWSSRRGGTDSPGCEKTHFFGEWILSLIEPLFSHL